MYEEKINIQLIMENLYNVCEFGEIFEDRDELILFKYNLDKFIGQLDKYERNNFNI